MKYNIPNTIFMKEITFTVFANQCIVSLKEEGRYSTAHLYRNALRSYSDYLKKSNLAKGGSLENALVFDENGLLNEGGLRFPLECVTHKVIDLLGDLALLGTIPTAHYIAVCAGHEMHGKLVDKLKRVLAR